MSRKVIKVDNCVSGLIGFKIVYYSRGALLNNTNEPDGKQKQCKTKAKKCWFGIAIASRLNKQ